MITNLILFIALAISFFTDIKNRKILNIVTFPSMLFGLVLHTIISGWDGFTFSLFGLLAGFGLLIIPHLMGGMAAGDVKLLMAIGALKGTSFVLGSFIYIAIIGGIIAFVILLVKKELLVSLRRIFFSARLRTFNTLSTSELHHAFPYGVAICFGTLSYFGVGYLW